jgi:hypothetical protein
MQGMINAVTAIAGDGNSPTGLEPFFSKTKDTKQQTTERKR